MKSHELDTILLANTYLVKCQLDETPSHRQELARKYLTSKIKKTLNKRKILNKESSIFKVFSFFMISFLK
jgi:hypothetical protein